MCRALDTAPDRVSGAHASHASGIGRAAEGGSDLGAPRREGRNPERARRRSRDAKKPQSPTYPIQEHPRCHPEREPSSKARNSPWKMLLVSRWDEHSCYRGVVPSKPAPVPLRKGNATCRFCPAGGNGTRSRTYRSSVHGHGGFALLLGSQGPRLVLLGKVERVVGAWIEVQ